MSTDEEHTDPSYSKRRRVAQRACDNCRRKKRRCDKPKPPHNKCSNCIEHSLDCTYEDTSKKRGRVPGYVEGLERRIQMLEVTIKKLCPNQTALYNLLSPMDPEYAASLTNRPVTTAISSIMPPSASSSSETSKETTSSNAMLNIIHKIASLNLGSDDDSFRDDEDFENVAIAAQTKLIPLSHKPEDINFWGKSSAASFLLTAILAKNEYAKNAPVKWKISQGKRPIYWTRLPWVKDPVHSLPVKYTFPPPNLITKLTIAYFEHVNLFYPLLHRPTFERAVADNLHFRDEGFGGILLLVCAIGSRYLDKIDPRTLADGIESSLSAGWKWYIQVNMVKLGLVESPTLYEIQSYCLAAHFLLGYSPQAVWILVGLGIRLAQDVGVHRRRVPRGMLTVEDELWKRAFWVLIAMDRMISMGIGRQCAIFDEHFDLDMPVDCDDEYWEHPDPKKRFIQPDGVPSTVTAFNYQLRLNKIMAFTLNTIYSTKTKLWGSVSEKWEQHVVTELDSATNNWISSLPEYLRWDPNRTDDRFFRLSGCLVAYYYHIQIFIHRRYITKNQSSPLAYPSLAICNSAARSCSMILEQQMKRNVIVYPYMQMAVAPVVIVLLLNTWGSKRSGVTADKDMRHVEQCLNVLRRSEDRWHSAGKLMDVLNELASVGEFVLPEVDHDPDLPADSVDHSRMRASCLRVESQEGDTVEQQQDASESSFLDETVPMSEQGLSTMPNPISQCMKPEYPSLPTASATINDSYNIFDAEFPQPENWIGNQPSDSESYNLMSAGYPTFDDTPNNMGTSTFENISSNSNTAPTAFSQQQTIVDNNTMAMWLTAPTSFQLNEWNAFVTNFSEISNELGDVSQSEFAFGS